MKILLYALNLYSEEDKITVSWLVLTEGHFIRGELNYIEDYQRSPDVQ